jgi:hypothetical protein
MKKLLLFLILTFTILNVHAKWVVVGTNEEADIYVKTDSIKRIGHMVTYWETLDYKSAQKVDEKEYYSLKMKNETNCNTEENKTLFMAVYSESMGSGKVIDTWKMDKEVFREIIPDSLAYIVFKFVCGKKLR